MTIHEKIRYRIKRLGVTQLDVAARAGIQPQNLSGFLRGVRSMPLAQIESLCRVLGLTLGPADKVYNDKD